MHPTSESILQGTVFGLAAGIAPGPLLALVVSETVRHGTAAGVRVALAPLVTDLPIIAASLLLLGAIASRGTLLGAIGLAGSIFVFYLGWENLRLGTVELEAPAGVSRSFRRGVAVNALSPHPYLFWLTVGGPITTGALAHGVAPAAAFVGSFYLLLVGSKMVLALAVGRTRGLLKGRAYLLTMRLLGLLLCLLAALLLRDGVRLLLAGR